MKRNFESWLLTMKDSIATWNYYTDFPKVYENVNKLKVELNILNSLIGSKNIEDEFKALLSRYPEIIKAIPILLAKREKEIKVIDSKETYVFNFAKMNYTVDQYALFMKNSGLFELLQNHIINNLIDYVLGVEVGMDTNGRKNRTGDAMEDLVESYLIKAGLVKGETYFKELNKSDVERMFHLDLSGISNQDKTEKRFDFVFKGPLGDVYACECNFYSGGGSKLNETARSYKTLALEAQGISRFTFVWFTDGLGWNSARHNLEETFDVLDTVYNIKDLEDGIAEKLLDAKHVINEILVKNN
ncbi:uncharacterized protein BN617_00382 [Firmicutes bacterium CAG:345]|nr:uncharacterized protein BN617_00382 [Firmicutes bacterium CAG:345]